MLSPGIFLDGYYSRIGLYESASLVNMGDGLLRNLKRKTLVDPTDVSAWAAYAIALERQTGFGYDFRSEPGKTITKNCVFSSMVRERMSSEIERNQLEAPEEKLIQHLLGLGIILFQTEFEREDIRYRLSLKRHPRFINEIDTGGLEELRLQALSENKKLYSGPHTHGSGEKIINCSRCFWINSYSIQIERHYPNTMSGLGSMYHTYWRGVYGEDKAELVAYLLKENK